MGQSVDVFSVHGRLLVEASLFDLESFQDILRPPDLVDQSLTVAVFLSQHVAILPDVAHDFLGFDLF